jgi:xanthine/CO dehydrogenase XdhC/CoxF family maturation factor
MSEQSSMTSNETDILAQAADWLGDGHQVALATVVNTWGSSPRPVGSQLAVNETQSFVGSVSGGCIEGAVIETAMQVMADGKPQLLEFGVTNEMAWEVGLACGGTVEVFVERME